MATKKDKLAGNNLLIMLLLVTLVVVGITALVGKSLITSIARDMKVASAKAKADDQLKKNLTNAPKLVASYQNLGSQGMILADALPSVSDLPSLLVTYENMAAQAGVKLKSIGSDMVVASTVPAEVDSGTITPSTPQTYNLTFAFDGNYVGLSKLFKEIELSARPMRITGVVFRGSGSTLSGDVTAQTYFQSKAKLPIGTEVIK